MARRAYVKYPAHRRRPGRQRYALRTDTSIKVAPVLVVEVPSKLATMSPAPSIVRDTESKRTGYKAWQGRLKPALVQPQDWHEQDGVVVWPGTARA